MRQWSGGWPWRASRNQNWLGSVNPMTRRRRRLARRRVALGEGGGRAPQVEACCGRAATTDFAVRTSSLISSTPRRHRSYAQGRPYKRCSTDPRPRDCDGEQHLEHLPRRSSGWRRISAVYIGPPPVLSSTTTARSVLRSIGNATRYSCRCSPGAIRLRCNEQTREGPDRSRGPSRCSPVTADATRAPPSWPRRRVAPTQIGCGHGAQLVHP